MCGHVNGVPVISVLRVKGILSIRAPEKFLNVVDIFILQKTGHW